MAMTSLTRFWFVFDRAASRVARAKPFVGVTAWNREDAEQLVREGMYGGAPLPPIQMVVDNVDVSTLDAGHVLSNMEPPNRRGVWYPRGHGLLE
ncbi:MAG: hypothetical protein LBV34_10890 [Nocardiopsaceae bacterium]|jgi:hypothetical protein|nr:hypothetical protein [Nocardiopsaceae bacterium]